MKFTLKNYLNNILILYLFLLNISLNAQIIPHGLLAKRDTYSTTSIFADAQFKFRYYYSTPRIRSDFSFNFSNNTPYTFQFEFGIFEETVGISDYQIPLIGFTNDLLNTDKAIVMYSFKQQYTSLGINKYKVDDNVMHNVLNSNVDLNISKTQYGKPYEGYKSAVITTTYDGSRWKTYKNGILIDEIVNTSSWNGSGNLIIGNDRISNLFANLYLYFDEIRFWNRALSSEELSNNWNKPLQGNENGLKLYYNFNNQGYPAYNNLAIDNSKIQYLNDLSPNKYKGTFINSGLYGYYNNFYRRISEIYNPILFSPIFYFDASNADSYPGTGYNGNLPSLGKLYNLNEFNNNLQFYSNSNYDQIVSPNYHGDGGRSLGIYNIYGKSSLNSGIATSSPISMETWVKINSLSDNSIVSIGENYDGKIFDVAVFDARLKINLGPNYYVLSNKVIAKNTWYYVVCVFDGQSNYLIYVNGILEGSAQFSNLQNTINTPLYIGRSQRPFNGIISKLNVYNKSLNTSEIEKKFATTKSRFGY